MTAPLFRGVAQDGEENMNNNQPNQSLSSELTLQELIGEYRHITEIIKQKWPIDNHEKRVLARTLKMMEELGELSDAILSSMQLQRASKVEQFQQVHVEDEFADVLGCVILLGIELDINIEEVIKRKIRFTQERLVREVTTAHPHTEESADSETTTS